MSSPLSEDRSGTFCIRTANKQQQQQQHLVLCMDVFALLKAEDDNPRGQAGGRYLSGDSLEAAAAAEQRRLEIKAARWTKGRQEEGILHLIKAKTLFQRLKLPEPRWVDGTAQWHVSQEQVDAAYEDLKKACHPEWSFHPQAQRGYALLREAFDTLSDANGRRDAYVREVAELVREREALVSATSSTTSGCGMAAASAGGASRSSSGSSRAALAAAAAADAADIEEQNKRRRLMLEEKRRALTDKPGQAQRPTATTSDVRPSTNVEDDGDDDEGGGGSGGAAVRAAREKLKAAGRKRRPGMF
jgi:curved DNA-binding protein CbpA